MSRPDQNDFDKLRRIPWFHASVVLTSTAMLCTMQAPLALFAAEMGLSEDRIGLLGAMMPFFQVAGLAALPIIAWLGARRVAAGAMLTRYLFLTLFFLTPLVAGRPDAVFALLLVAAAGFSLMRAVAEAALVPWSQDFVPRAVRGRIAGRNAAIYVPVALVVSWGIRQWLDAGDGIARFFPVFLFGIVAGIVGALALLGLGGGAPEPRQARAGPRLSTLAEPLRDANFRLFLISAATQFLVFTVVNLFLVLHFRTLGLSSGQIVFMAALTPVGAALGTLASGWLVDRYGTRSVYVTLSGGQVLLLLVVPWFPAGTPLLPVLAAASFVAFGLFVQSALVVANVYMLNVVPPSVKEAYTTVKYIIVGLVSGGATWGAGVLLAWLGEVPLRLGGIAVSNFAVMFLLTALISVFGALAFSRLREEDGLPLRDFFANFSTGSSMRALWSIHRYGAPSSEERRRELAFGLGTYGSPLAKQELIEALRDPSFDVRYEAVQALGHLAPHHDVMEALARVLRFNGLVELQYAALASMGQLKAAEAAPHLAPFLQGAQPILRARAVRSLGEIGAVQHLGDIRRCLEADPELDVRLAAVSALGKLKDTGSLPKLVAVYLEQAAAPEPIAVARSKVVLLAIAKILNCEESFAHDWLREQRSSGQAVPDLMLRLSRMLRWPEAEGLAPAATDGDSAERFAAALALRPAVERSAHPDAAGVAQLMAQVAGVEAPHPALVILLLVTARRVLRR